MNTTSGTNAEPDSAIGMDETDPSIHPAEGNDREPVTGPAEILEWGARLTAPRHRLRRWPRSPLSEYALVGLGAAAMTTIVTLLVRSVTSLWLPLDAAHYVAEADWLRGQHSILPNIHPPAFPGLVYFIDIVTSRWDAVLIAMTISYSLYLVAVYVLIRQHHRPIVATVATLVAAPTPVLAEIIGWGGGSNLMGMAAALGALAMTERWIRCDRGGLSTGLAVGLAIATHPLGGTLALSFVLLRTVFEVGHLRQWSWRWRDRSVCSCIGWLQALSGCAPFVAASAYYYLGVQTPGEARLGWPSLPVLFDLISWAGREHPLIVVLHLSAIVAPFVLISSPTGRAARTISVVTVLGASSLRGDPSYQSRFMYLMPALIALLAAEVLPPTRHVVALRQGTPRRRVGWWALAVGMIALYQVGFEPRLTTAIDYYERLDVEDVALLSTLRSATGTIGSSYWDDSTAEPTNWFVNAAAQHIGWSPIGPWLSTIGKETDEGQMMQRFFSGQVGIENGALQISASGTDDGYYSFDLSVRSHDWYFPVALLDTARSRWPFPITSASATIVDGNKVALFLRGRGPNEEVQIRASLVGTQVTMSASTDEATAQWHIVLATPQGLPWTPDRTGGESTRIQQSVSDNRLTAELSSSSDEVLTRLTLYGSGDPIDVDASGTRAVTIKWGGLEGLGSIKPTTSFDERTLGVSMNLTDVVVWRNTNLVERFQTSCYAQRGESTSIVVFHINSNCSDTAQR